MNRQNPIVSAHWLRQHRDDPQVVVLDARIRRTVDEHGARHYACGRDDFEQSGHIPGAGFADLFGAFSDPAGRFAFTRPPLEQLQAELRRLGVNEHDHVVVYDSLNGAWAARVWWLLLAYGHPRVSVLGGGVAQWQAGGGALVYGTDMPAAPGNASLRVIAGRFVDVPQVKQWLGQPGNSRLVCGLRGGDYSAGHIPGSLSLPYAQWLDGQGMLEIAQVQRSTAALQIKPGDELTLYCRGGVNACALALGLMAAGHGAGDLHVYDGSLNEWRADPSLPLVRGPQP